MSYKTILKNEEFEIARLIIYVVLVIWYIILENFIHVQCPGCHLCGMTRAVRNLFMFDFIKAFQYNHNILIFIILLIIIIIDIISIFIHRIKAK